MTTKYYALLTNLGASKLANAAALGTKLQITQMAVGDGGGTLPTPNATQTKLVGEKRRAALNSLSIDAANSSQIIAEQVIPETEGGFWIREVGLFDADGVLIAVANCAETYKPQLQEGSGRTQTVRMILIVSSTDAVTLKIDPSIVLATRQYVDNAVIEVKAYADDLMAKHVAAADPHTQYAPKASPTLTGTPKAPTPAASKNDTQIATTAFTQAVMKAHTDAADPHSQYLQKTQLSSDTNSTSESQAATPKAVKAVNDAAFKLMGNIASGVDFNTLGSDKAGRWGITTTAATSNPNIPEAALGYLDVIPYGSYGCTHRYTARSGNEYERYLTANWNGTNGPWSDWLRLGEQPYPTYFDGNMDTLVSPCTYSVTGIATGGPLSSGLTGILNVKIRLSTNSVVQRFTTVVPPSSVYHNRTWERVMSTTWGPWAEQITMPATALPSGTSNITGPMLFGFDGSGTDQATTHQPVAGETFGGLAVPRGLRPAQFGVSGRGSSASFWFRGFNNAASDLTEWKQVTTTVNAVPIGVPMPWPAETAPTGWLKCNGASFSATTYPELAKAYPSLKLPDLRGEFIRGWDDGRGIDTSRAILSLQTDALQRITGTLEMGNGIGLMTSPHASTNGAFTEGPSREQTPTTQQKAGFAVTFDSANVVRSATETRPRNVAFNYIVRAA